MLKASAGGGGRGMRVVRDAKSLVFYYSLAMLDLFSAGLRMKSKQRKERQSGRSGMTNCLLRNILKLQSTSKFKLLAINMVMYIIALSVNAVFNGGIKKSLKSVSIPHVWSIIHIL